MLGKLGKLGKLAKTGAKLLPRAGSADEVDLTGTLVAEHFKPLKGAIAEVDGQPPALDAAVVALTALSNVLQTVTANPDPQDAIKKQGGLAELTGAVARQAQILPDPIDDWLGGIAGDTSGLTEKAVTSELNAIWRADILPFCQAALNDRYPFSPESAVDVNVRDFARLFGPAGMIDAFINDHLISYVDTASQPWKWRADFGLDPSALAAFEQARRIRDDLFPGGTGPVMSFTLEPKDLSPNVTRVTLNLDGQSLVYFNNATRPQPMTWPGKDGTGVITLAFQPIDGSPEVMVSETGSWAWLRMLRSGRFTGTSLSDVYSLRLGTKGLYADFELQGRQRRKPLQPGDVQEIHMSAADLILPGFYGKMPADRRFRHAAAAGRLCPRLGSLAGATPRAADRLAVLARPLACASWPAQPASAHRRASSCRAPTGSAGASR